VVSMPLRSALTPALRVAPWLERGLAVLAVVAAGVAVLTARRGNRPAGPPVQMAGHEASSVGSAVG
jgi:apolipoprotein N-acyltransferase